MTFHITLEVPIGVTASQHMVLASSFVENFLMAPYPDFQFKSLLALHQQRNTQMIESKRQSCLAIFGLKRPTMGRGTIAKNPIPQTFGV